MAERQGFEPRQRLRVDRLAICSITTLAPLLIYIRSYVFKRGCKCNFLFEYKQTNNSIFSQTLLQ